MKANEETVIEELMRLIKAAQKLGDRLLEEYNPREALTILKIAELGISKAGGVEMPDKVEFFLQKMMDNKTRSEWN